MFYGTLQILHTTGLDFQRTLEQARTALTPPAARVVPSQFVPPVYIHTYVCTEWLLEVQPCQLLLCWLAYSHM